MNKNLTLLLAASLLLSGCLSTENPDRHAPSGTSMTPMRIAGYYWPGQFWVDIAAEKDWFTEGGLKTEIIDTNADYNASLKAVAEGGLDTQNYYLFDLVQHRLDGNDLVLVVGADRSSGSDGIVASKEIDTPQKLKGKKVGLIPDSNSEYMFYIFLNSEGIQTQDVTIVEVNPENGPDLLRKGEIDAFVGFEPYLSESIAEGNIRLFDSDDLPGVTMAGYVFRRDFIQERPEDVQAFVKVWHRTTQYIKNNTGEAYGIIARKYGVTLKEVEEFAQLDTALDLKENIAAFSYSAGYDTMHGSIRQMTGYFEEKGIDTSMLDSSTFIDSRFIHVLSDTIVQ